MRSVLIFLIVAIVSNVNAFTGLLTKSSKVSLSRRMMSEVETSQVFVGNLPFNVDEGTLTNMIKEKYSSDIQNVKIIKDRDTGKSRGFAYVTYNTKTEAENAVIALKDLQVDGRSLKVDVSGTAAPTRSTERPPRSPRSNENKLFLGNLDFKATEADVQNLASSILGPGVLKKVDLVLDKETRRPRGFGYLHFSDKEGMDLALTKMNGATLMNRELRLDLAAAKDGEKRDSRPSYNNDRRDSAPRDFKSSRPPRVNSEFSLYFGNLAWEVTEKIIEEMLTDVIGPGVFSNIRMATDRETGKSRGFCHVDFINAESMERALVELEGMAIYERVLRIDKAASREKKSFEERSSDGYSPRKPRSGGERYASTDSDQQSGFNNY